MHFNFEATTYYDLCGISDQRGQELAAILEGAVKYIANNNEPYMHYGTGANAGKIGLHKGKVLNYIFSLVEDKQERVIALFTFDIIMEKIISRIQKKEIAEMIKKVAGDIFDL